MRQSTDVIDVDLATAIIPDWIGAINLNSNLSGRMVMACCPIGLGTSAMIEAVPESGTTFLTKELAEAAIQGENVDKVFYISFDEKPEEYLDLNRLVTKYPDKFLSWSIRPDFDRNDFGMDAKNVQQKSRMAIQTLIEKAKMAKADAENNKQHVLFIVDGLTRVIRLCHLVFDSKVTLEGGLYPIALEFMRTIMTPWKGNKWEDGSFATLSTFLLTNKSDELIAKEARTICSTRIVLTKDLFESRKTRTTGIPAISLSQSIARGDYSQQCPDWETIRQKWLLKYKG